MPRKMTACDEEGRALVLSGPKDTFFGGCAVLPCFQEALRK